MSKQKYNHPKIVDALIEKSFPELKGKKIFVFEIWMPKKYTAGVTGLGIYFVTINKDHSGTLGELKAVLAHELCHIITLGPRNILYWFNKKIRRDIERETDKEAIRRGYARGLYGFWKKNKRRYSKISQYYLSPEEIRSYAKEIGKW